jgi:competence protein ComEA
VRGLGPAITARIIAAREKAPFRNWDEFILRVPGIGPARAYQLSAEGLTVNGESYQIQGVTTPPGVPAIPKAPAAPAAPPKPALPKLQ